MNCNLSDFLMTSAMNIGLTQPKELNHVCCFFCMKYKGKSIVPSSLDVIYTKDVKKQITP